MEHSSRWLDQTVFAGQDDDPTVVSGNCVQASVASILGLPLDEVPSFLGLKSFDFWEALEEFLLSKGYEFRMQLPYSHVKGLYLASGDTVRGTQHMVVMEGDALKHDPHPSKQGLKSIHHVWILLPLDPAK